MNPNWPEATPSPTPASTHRLHRRFDRMGRLVGDTAMEKLSRSHVMIVGLGGVGSWAAEALARSGVGKLSLVDFDEVCVTNFNRQLHALQGTVGQKKAVVLAERLAKINPQAEIVTIPKFYNAEYHDEIFAAAGGAPDHLIDGIDNVTAKCQLLAACKSLGIPVVSATGSGGRLDPGQVRMTDLSQTEKDPLARAVRRILRERYGFPAEGPFGIPAVYSIEPPQAPAELQYDGGQGFKCVCPQGDNPYFQCDNRNLILGNASFVTGAFGLHCASHVVRELLVRS